MTRRLVYCLIFALCSMAHFAYAGESDRTYDTTIEALTIGEDGTTTSTTVAAKLNVRFADEEDAEQRLSISLDGDKSIDAYRVGAAALPPEYRGMLPDGQTRFFSVPAFKWVYVGDSAALSSDAVIKPNPFTRPFPQYTAVPVTGPVELPIYLGKASRLVWLEETVLGGDGKPLADFPVSVWATPSTGHAPREVLLAETTTNEDGVFGFPYPLSTEDDWSLLHQQSDNPSSNPVPGLHIRITDPALGQYIDNPHKSVLAWHLIPLHPDVFTLGFVPADKIDDAETFRGRVVDEEGKGLAFARLTITGFGAKEEVGFHATSVDDYLDLYTGPDGRFAFRIPPSKAALADARIGGEPIEFVSLIIRKPDAETRVIDNSYIRLRAGIDREIELRNAADLVCELLGDDGQPLIVDDRRMLPYDGSLRRIVKDPYAIPMIGGGERAEMINLDGPGAVLLKVKTIVLPGEFQLEYNNRLYEPRQIDWADAEHPIVWRPITKRAVLSGRAVDAENGAPVAGAIVLLTRRGGGGDPRKDLQSDMLAPLLEQVPPGGSIALSDCRDLLPDSAWNQRWKSVVCLGKTNDDGAYRLTGSPGASASPVVVFAPGYLVMSADAAFLFSDERNPPDLWGEFDLPVTPLYREAAAEVTVVLPRGMTGGDFAARSATEREDNVFTTVEFDDPPGWVPRDTATKWKRTYPVWSPARNDAHGAIGKPITVAIPAGVPYALRAKSLHQTDRFGPARWDDQPPVAAGVTVTLEPHPFELSKEVLVYVHDAAGRPMPDVGITVSSSTYSRSRTNNEGFAIARFAGDRVVTAYVMTEQGGALFAPRQYEIEERDGVFVLELNAAPDKESTTSPEMSIHKHGDEQ